MKKIVIVEDNKTVARVSQLKLMAAGFEVEVASDGEAGLPKISHVAATLEALTLLLKGQLKKSKPAQAEVGAAKV